MIIADRWGLASNYLGQPPQPRMARIPEVGDRRLEVQPEFTQVADDVIIGSSSWLGDDGRRRGRYQVLRLRDGKIVDMQGCATRRQAERFAQRHD